MSALCEIINKRLILLTFLKKLLFSKLNDLKLMDMFNKMIAGMLPYLPKNFVWIFSKRYIAGKKIQDAIRVSRELNKEGIKVTVDLLGEFITKLSEAEKNKVDPNIGFKMR